MSEHGMPTFLWDPELNRTIHDALPEIVVDFFAVMTRFGDGATVVGFAILFYWFGSEADWRKRGMLMAIAVATLALNAGIKGILGIPRPLFIADPPFAFAPEVYDGYATPSAHAMGAAAIYGGLAYVMKVGKAWQRYLVAAFLITVVSLSRVVLGLHYLGDVITGVILGLALIAFAIWLTDEEPRSVYPMFVFAFVVAVVSRLLGSQEFVTMSIGAALGGMIMWLAIHDRSPSPTGGAIVLFGLILIPFLVGFRVFEALITLDILLEVAGWEVPVMAGIRITGYATIFGLALAIPVIAERFNDHPYAVWLQEVLPFRGRTVDINEVEIAESLDD